MQILHMEPIILALQHVQRHNLGTVCYSENFIEVQDCFGKLPLLSLPINLLLGPLPGYCTCVHTPVACHCPQVANHSCVYTLYWFLFLMFSMVCCYAWVLLLCTIGSTSSSPAQFMVVNRKVDTPSVTEPEYWSIKSNSPGPRISYLTNRHNQNHYVVNTSPAVSSHDQNAKDNSESQWRSKIVTL